MLMIKILHFLWIPSNLSRMKIWKELTQKFSFHNFCTSFCPWLMQYEVLFYEILCCVTFHCVLCYITLHYKFNSHQFTYRSKQHAQKVCIFNKKCFFFSIEDTMIIQNNYKEKSWLAYKIWKNHPSKNGIISLLSTYRKKIRETRSMDRRLGSGWPRTVSKEENMDLIEEFIFSQEQQLHMH